jgi:hypothetical protein
VLRYRADAVNDLGVLVEALHPFPGGPCRGSGGLVVEGEDARPQTEVESSVGKVINCHRLLGGRGRRSQDRVGDQCADAYAMGDGGSDREKDPGVVPRSGEAAQIACVAGQE